IRTDANGDTLWTKTFGGNGTDNLYSVLQTSEDGFIIATGATESFGAGSYDVYLIKTDSLGNVGCNIASSTATITTNAATVVGSTNITVQSGVDVQYHTTFVNNAFTIVTDISVTNPVVDLGNDTSICDTCSITLDAGTEFISYSWYTGENTQTITVDSAGTYIVQVIDSNECSDSDSIIISLLPTSVNEEKNSLRSVYVLPNPSDGTFTIINQTLLNGEFWSITLHDILGRLIYEKENISNSQFTIDISDQPKGMYFVKSNTHTQYKNALVRKIILR
ncbi:MAG: T9SS type A sorting domain-containing protein, partial [Cytophagales bacterium]|nr:T9SS type A sorting domain-containing protein [Cytophagales bacterium]